MTIFNNIFLNNKADCDGAIYIGGNLTLTNTLLENNILIIAGGAIYYDYYDMLMVSNSTFLITKAN